MNSFLHTRRQPSELPPSSFTDSLLRRLDIMRAVAAIRYGNPEVVHSSSMLTKSIENKCKKRRYNDAQTQSAVAIFQAINALLQSIQTACLTEWEGLSMKEVQKKGLLSAKQILSSFKDKDQQDVVNAYIIQCTDQIIGSLAHLDVAVDLGKVQLFLIQQFPCIDKDVANESIDTLGVEIEKLRTSYDYVVIENDNDLQDSVQKNQTDAGSYCSIS